jgi:hypothetical protein
MQGNSFTVNTFGNASGNIYSNCLQGTPSGMYQCASFQHNPGVSAAVQWQVGGNNFTFQSNGVGIAPAGWQTSDRRIKKNITPFSVSDAITTIMSIPVVEWDRIEADEATGEYLHQVGWIAQDVQPHFPKAVHEYDDWRSLPPLEEGGESRLENRGKKLALDHSAMTALLWKAVQELTTRLTQLEAQA